VKQKQKKKKKGRGKEDFYFARLFVVVNLCVLSGPERRTTMCFSASSLFAQII